MKTGRRRKADLAQHFRCTRYRLTLSRATCALMHKRGNTSVVAGRGAMDAAVSPSCRRCPIGEAHRKGTVHPDAPSCAAPTPVVTVRVKARACMGCGAALPRNRRWYCSPACGSDAARAFGDEHSIDNVIGG